MTDPLLESRLEDNTSSLCPDDTASKADASQSDQSLSPTSDMMEKAHTFRKLWPNITVDNYLTLFGFRRFRTAHLLNLRFLEDEISRIDRKIYQAGLQLDLPPANMDKLGLRHGKRDTNAPEVEEVINQNLVLKLRELIKQYDEGLVTFNQVMLMETFALADDDWQSHLRGDLNAYELYKTRLVRVDLAQRSGSRDVLRHSLRKGLRAFWFFIRSGGIKHERKTQDLSKSASDMESSLKGSYQNTARLAEVITRFLVALIAGAFLVVPMVILANQSSRKAQLITVSMCIVVFSFLISLISMASNEQIMLAAAAYAAVLVVFLSNSC